MTFQLVLCWEPGLNQPSKYFSCYDTAVCSSSTPSVCRHGSLAHWSLWGIALLMTLMEGLSSIWISPHTSCWLSGRAAWWHVRNVYICLRFTDNKESSWNSFFITGFLLCEDQLFTMCAMRLMFLEGFKSPAYVWYKWSLYAQQIHNWGYCGPSVQHTWGIWHFLSSSNIIFMHYLTQA